MGDSVENGLSGWRRPFPDLTTETILRIDSELARTQAHRERLDREALCLTCGERGVHVHVFPPGGQHV